MTPVNWAQLADNLGTITWNDHGHQEMGGTQVAREALAAILGDEVLRSAVDFYLSCQPGFEVAKSVLHLLAPPVAMEHCRERFRAAGTDEEAAAAVELLRWVADVRVLDWMDEFLASHAAIVRSHAIGILDQLWMSGEIEPDPDMPLLLQGLADSDDGVRVRAEQVRAMWRDAQILEAGATGDEVREY